MPFKFRDARQYKRIRKVIQRQRTIVGRLQREMGRKMSALGLAVQETLGHTLSQAQRLISQTASKKNPGKQGKLYSWHAPEVECISKGKSRTPYEFGVKVGIATKLQGNLIVGARSFPGNPYDGHTLNEQVVQAIEPVIGHLKADHRMNRCHLKGADGNSLHVVLCAAGYNIRWLLRMIVKKGLGLLLCLLQTADLTALLKKLAAIYGRNRLQNSDQRWALA